MFKADLEVHSRRMNSGKYSIVIAWFEGSLADLAGTSLGPFAQQDALYLFVATNWIEHSRIVSSIANPPTPLAVERV